MTIFTYRLRFCSIFMVVAIFAVGCRESRLKDREEENRRITYGRLGAWKQMFLLSRQSGFRTCKEMLNEEEPLGLSTCMERLKSARKEDRVDIPSEFFTLLERMEPENFTDGFGEEFVLRSAGRGMMIISRGPNRIDDLGKADDFGFVLELNNGGLAFSELVSSP